MDVSVADLKAALAAGARVIDVREPDEWADGHVSGTEFMPMRTVPARLEDLRDEEIVYVVCAVGARSAVVVEFLEAQGVPARNVAGGVVAWAQAGLPLETGPAA